MNVALEDLSVNFDQIQFTHQIDILQDSRALFLIHVEKPGLIIINSNRWRRIGIEEELIDLVIMGISHEQIHWALIRIGESWADVALDRVAFRLLGARPDGLVGLFMPEGSIAGV